MVKIRLKRMGAKYNAFYRIVVADERSPRNGRFIEEIGYYNPHSKEIRVDLELKNKWLAHGASMTKTVKNLLTKVKKIELASNEVGKLPKREKVVKKVAPQVIEDVATSEDSKKIVAPTSATETTKEKIKSMAKKE